MALELKQDQENYTDNMIPTIPASIYNSNLLYVCWVAVHTAAQQWVYDSESCDWNINARSVLLDYLSFEIKQNIICTMITWYVQFWPLSTILAYIEFNQSLVSVLLSNESWKAVIDTTMPGQCCWFLWVLSKNNTKKITLTTWYIQYLRPSTTLIYCMSVG